MEEPFADPSAPQKWAEFNTGSLVSNPERLKVNLFKENQLWHYLGQISTEARAKFTENPAIRRHNINSSFLDTVKPPLPRLPIQTERRSYPASYPSGANVNALNGAMVAQRQQWKAQQLPLRKPLEPQSSQHRKPVAHQTEGSSAVPMQWKSQDSKNWHSSYKTVALRHDKRANTQLGDKDIATGYPYQTTSNQAKNNEHLQSTVSQPVKIESASHASINNSTLPHLQMPYIEGTRYNKNCEQKCPAAITQPEPPNQVRCVAPVAKMMGSQSSQNSNLSKAPTGYSISTLDPNLISQIEYLSYIQQFPFLRNSYLRRPKTYESPYASGGGISTKYLEGLEQQCIQGSDHKQPTPISQHELRVSGLTAENTEIPQSQLLTGSFPDSQHRGMPSGSPGAGPQNSSLSSQTAQYHTDEQFRRQVDYDNESIATNSKLKRLIAQLGAGNTRNPEDKISCNADNGLALRKPGARSGAASFKVTEDAPSVYVKSPVRPEASPLSDVA